jgi:hypothetical protein
MDRDSHGSRRSSARQTIVTTSLTLLAAAFFLLVLVVITGSYFVYLLGIIAAIVAFGAFHYLLWGRDLLQQTAGESEEEQLRLRGLRALDEDATEPPDERIRQ